MVTVLLHESKSAFTLLPHTCNFIEMYWVGCIPCDDGGSNVSVLALVYVHGQVLGTRKLLAQRVPAHVCTVWVANPAC